MPSLNLRNVLRRNPDRPSLRERAEALKVSAAKVIGRKAPPASDRKPAGAKVAVPVRFDAYDHETGIVTYEDLSGTVRKRPAADCIGYMSSRLYHIARSGRDRQFNTECQDLDRDACAALEAKIARSLRIDALHALVYQSDKIFAEAPAKRECGEGVKLFAAGGADAGEPAAEDAAALALRTAIEREWAAQLAEERQEWDCVGAEADARAKARLDRQTALVKAAGELPNGTKETQHAKALALAWSYSPDVWRPTLSREQHGTDGRLVVDLMEGLTGAVPAAHAPQAVGAAPPVLDLSVCSIRELARLYEALHATWDHLSALGQLPCFWSGNEPASRRNFNPAGKIIDREADRLAGLFIACADELARRAPRSEDDADEILASRLIRELSCEGRIRDAELMRDIARAWTA